MKTMKAAVLIAAMLGSLSLIALTGCGGGCAAVDADGRSLRNCDKGFDHSGDWFYHDLVLLHDEPRYCPVPGVSAGATVDVSDVVVDGGAREYASGTLIAMTSGRTELNRFEGSFRGGALGWQGRSLHVLHGGNGHLPGLPEICNGPGTDVG